MSMSPLSSPALGVTDIVRSVENMLFCSGPYSLWTIGLAIEISQARASRDRSGLWLDWKADSQETACRVLDHFTRLGMVLDAVSDEGGTYVYIF